MATKDELQAIERLDGLVKGVGDAITKQRIQEQTVAPAGAQQRLDAIYRRAGWKRDPTTGALVHETGPMKAAPAPVLGAAYQSPDVVRPTVAPTPAAPGLAAEAQPELGVSPLTGADEEIEADIARRLEEARLQLGAVAPAPTDMEGVWPAGEEQAALANLERWRTGLSEKRKSLEARQARGELSWQKPAAPTPTESPDVVALIRTAGQDADDPTIQGYISLARNAQARGEKLSAKQLNAFSDDIARQRQHLTNQRLAAIEEKEKSARAAATERGRQERAELAEKGRGARHEATLAERKAKREAQAEELKAKTAREAEKRKREAWDKKRQRTTTRLQQWADRSAAKTKMRLANIQTGTDDKGKPIYEERNIEDVIRPEHPDHQIYLQRMDIAAVAESGELTPELASRYLELAGGDRAKAEKWAKEDGFTWTK